MSSKDDIITFSFQRVDYLQMRRLVKMMLNRKVNRFTSLQSACRLLKTMIIEAQLKCISEGRVESTKSRRTPAES